MSNYTKPKATKVTPEVVEKLRMIDEVMENKLSISQMEKIMGLSNTTLYWIRQSGYNIDSYRSIVEAKSKHRRAKADKGVDYEAQGASQPTVDVDHSDSQEPTNGDVLVDEIRALRSEIADLIEKLNRKARWF